MDRIPLPTQSAAPTPGGDGLPSARANALADREQTSAPYPFVEWLDPEKLRSVADDRVDLGEYLRHRAVPRSNVTWQVRLLVWVVLAACVALIVSGVL